MVCPMRGVLVALSAIVAIVSAIVTAVCRTPRLSDCGSTPASPRAAEPRTAAGVAKAAALAVWDAATGRYLARQAGVAWRAVSRSPSPRKGAGRVEEAAAPADRALRSRQ